MNKRSNQERKEIKRQKNYKQRNNPKKTKTGSKETQKNG